MASGNSLVTFVATDNHPPASAYATPDTRNAHPCLDFDAGTDESAIFSSVLPRHYAGGGLTVTLGWMASSATTGDVVWNAAIERHADDSVDLDTDHFAAAQAATGTTASASGEVQYTSITFTNGAQMDSLAVGESFRMKVTRDADNGSDTMTGDAELLFVSIIET
jgi:hypothetical protein